MVNLLPLTPVAEQYSATMLQRENNAPPTMSVDHIYDSRVLNNFAIRADHEFRGGFYQNKPGHTDESMEGGWRYENTHAQCGT